MNYHEDKIDGGRRAFFGVAAGVTAGVVLGILLMRSAPPPDWSR